MFPDDVKFCPYCGNSTLFEEKNITKCHGCGEEFAVLEAEDIEDLWQTFDAHRDCPDKAMVELLEDLQDAVGEFLADGLSREELRESYEDTI